MQQRKGHLLVTLQNNIETVLSHENVQTLAGIDARLHELQAELPKLASSNVDYEDVADEIYCLSEDKQKVQLESAVRDELKKTDFRYAHLPAGTANHPDRIHDKPLVRAACPTVDRKSHHLRGQIHSRIQIRRDGKCLKI